MYKVVVERRVDKETRRIPTTDFGRILASLKDLAETPRPLGAKKLTTQEGYRIRVGEYRILYYIDDEEKTITVYRIKRRGEDTYA